MKSVKERVLAALDKAAGIRPVPTSSIDWNKIEPTPLPQAFRDRVMVRLGRGPESETEQEHRWPWWKRIAAGLTILVVVGGTVWYAVEESALGDSGSTAPSSGTRHDQTQARMNKLAFEDCLELLFEREERIKWREFAQLRVFTRTQHGIRALQALAKRPDGVGQTASMALDSLQRFLDEEIAPEVVAPGSRAVISHARALATLRDPASSSATLATTIADMLPLLQAGLDALKRSGDMPAPISTRSETMLRRLRNGLAR